MMYAIIFLTMFLASAPAFAYFDPGTGSLLIQGLIGALAFAAIFWQQLKAKISSILSGNTHEPSSGEDDTSTEEHSDIETQDEKTL